MISGVTFEYTEKDAEGRLRGTGKTFKLEADQVFKAIGQNFNDDFLQSSGLPAIENSRIRVDEERRTSLPGVWAGGDCIAGGDDLTVSSVQDGKIAAHAINQFLEERE